MRLVSLGLALTFVAATEVAAQKPAAITFKDIAGTWAGKTMMGPKDSVVAISTTTITADGKSTITLPNRPPMTAKVTAMGVAGAELAGYVKTLIVGNGAKYVTVVNLPDGSNAPGALLQDAATRGLINTMTTTFNAQLKAGLDGNANVLLVDAYTVANDQAVNPVPYGLTNVKDAACDLTPAKNPLGVSLVCNTKNLIAGVTDHYLFADNRGHPTPYGYLLLARFVSKEMAVRGWL